MAGLAENKEFCNKLKQHLQVGLDDKDKKNYKFYKNVIIPIRSFTTFVFLFLLPLVEMPSWCHDRISDSKRWDFTIKCAGLGVPESGIDKLNVLYMGFFNMACMLVFIYSRYFKRRFRLTADSLVRSLGDNAQNYRIDLLQQQEKSDKRENIALICAFAVMVIELIFAVVFEYRPYMTIFLRPIIVATFTDSIRENALTLAKDLRDAGVVLSMIFIFIFLYATICHYFYEGKYGGFQYFATMPMAYYRMLILLTTANFPDIMLPAYEQNFWNCLIFMSFLTIGLYFLSNVLLANVYTKFHGRLKEEGKQNMIDQERYLDEYLDRFDTDLIDVMTPPQTVHFFEEIFNFNVKKNRYDYDALKAVIREMAPLDPEKILKSEYLDFFLLRNGYKFTKDQQFYYKTLEQEKRNKALITFKSAEWREAEKEHQIDREEKAHE